MKKLWLLPVLLLAASVIIFTGCKDDDESSGGGAAEPKEITDFSFAEYNNGSGAIVTLSNSNKTIALNNPGNAGGFSYTLPDDWTDYSQIKFDYTCSITAGATKFILKKGSGWTDVSPETYVEFTGTSKTINLNLFTGETKIYFQHNSDGNSTPNYSIAFTKISLIP